MTRWRIRIQLLLLFGWIGIVVGGEVLIRSRNEEMIPKLFDYSCPLGDEGSGNSSARKYHENSGNLTISVSQRLLPQLVSRIYAISLQDFLQTGQRIYLRKEVQRNNFQADGEVVSLETWQMVDDHDTSKGQNNHHGSIYPIGVMGWFIPKLLINLRNSSEFLTYQKFQGNISEDLWMQFYVDQQTRKDIKEFTILDTVPKRTRTFTPPYCGRERRCVTLLADYYQDTSFVIRHIIGFNLSVEVIWLGPNLRRVIKKLNERYTQPDNEHFPTINRKFLVLARSPSAVIDGSVEFVQVRMPNCREIMQRGMVNCAYDYMPVVKYYNMEMPSPHVRELTHGFKFEEDAYRSLIRRYEEIEETQEDSGSEAAQEDLLNRVACEYVQSTPEFLKTNADDSFEVFNIELLLPPKANSIFANVQLPAEMAVESVNENPDVLSRVRLEISTRNISCNAESIMDAYLSTHMRGSRIVGIIGPPCSRGLDSVATFSEVIGMTTISYAATATHLDTNNGLRNFFRTIGESRYFEDSVLRVLDFFGWKRIATLSEEGLTSSYLTGSFELSLKEREVDTVVQFKLPVVEDSSTDLITKHLTEIKEKRAKIIFMEIYDIFTAIQILCAAYKLNVTAEEGFVWFLPSWIEDYDVTMDDSTKSLCSQQDLKTVLKYQFAFHYPPFKNNRQAVAHLKDSTTASWLREYKKLSRNETISNYGGYIYDSVWIYAFALDRMLRSGKLARMDNIHKPENHDQFLKEIKATNFTGVSGQIDFAEGQSRRPQILLSQWTESQFNTVGEERSDGLVVLDKLIKWPDGNPPSDGRDVCSVQAVASFLRLSCDTAKLTIAILVSILGAILASLIFYLYVRRFYNEKMKISAQVMRNLGIDLLNTTRAPENLLHDWEIPKDQIMLNRKLGEGAFGTVYGGQANIDDSQQAVAVKTLKVGSTSEDRLDFLSEAEAMKRFNHPNILKLLGVCLQSEPIFSVIEFMLYGDLKTYLLARRHLVKERIPDDSDVSAKRLTSMTIDIVRGLVYLADQKYVHRDIACRNCLVNADRRVKIADFGMARPTGSNDYYRFSRKGLLPVRWLSPESLGSGFFTPASDIWSFGVLLFEIVSFGAFPYQGLTNNQVLEFVKNGGSMNIPAGLKPALAKLMKSCWVPDYKKRPSAVQILEYISTNPRLVSPCIDVPKFSIDFSDSESGQLEFMPLVNQSTDSGVGSGMPITRETLQELSSMPTSQAAADAFQMRMITANNSNGQASAMQNFIKATNGGGGGGVPNGNASLNYNPVEPLLLRQNSNEMSSSSSSLLLRYVPMCGFGSKRPATATYTNHNPDGRSLDEYTRMSISEL